jgi:predicted amidohydrolase
MNIALIQMNSGADKAVNLASVERLIQQAMQNAPKGQRPDWVCLPEVFDCMGGSSAHKRSIAESIPDGPAFCLLQRLARDHRIFIHGGSILERDADRLFNTTLIFNREGVNLARYRKIHLFDVTTPDGQSYRESESFGAGDSVITYECEGVRIGCAICYDVRFPALFQALTDQGAQLIALPAAFTLQTGKDHWDVLCRARAIETQTYFCAAAQTGSFTMANGETRYTFGHSMIVDPWGVVIAQASDDPLSQSGGILCAQIDMARVAQVRAQIPVQYHRRLV